MFLWQQSGWVTPKLNHTVDPTEVSTHYREKRISKETRKEILLLFTLFKLKLVVVVDFSYYFQAFENSSSGISYYLWVLAKTTVRGNASQLLMKCIKFSALKLLAVLSKKKYPINFVCQFENCTTRLQVHIYLRNFHHTSIDTLNYDFFTYSRAR